MKIKNLVSNVIALTFVSLLFTFAFTWVVFDFEKSPSSLKDTWSIVSSIFGGISTLAAAYIAYYLYDDWRKPHNINIETEHKKEILKVARKIVPMERKYNNMISNHFIYYDQPNRTIPIVLDQNELSEFIKNVNDFLALMEELFFITNDEKIKNLNNHYLNYAQLYPYILNNAEHLYKNNEKQELVEFLRARLEFEYIDTKGTKWSSYTLYAYAFKGMRNSKIQQFISENLKSKLI